jgi:hypothetical protein
MDRGRQLLIPGQELRQPLAEGSKSEGLLLESGYEAAVDAPGAQENHWSRSAVKSRDLLVNSAIATQSKQFLLEQGGGAAVEVLGTEGECGKLICHPLIGRRAHAEPR